MSPKGRTRSDPILKVGEVRVETTPKKAKIPKEWTLNIRKTLIPEIIALQKQKEEVRVVVVARLEIQATLRTLKLPKALVITLRRELKTLITWLKMKVVKRKTKHRPKKEVTAAPRRVVAAKARMLVQKVTVRKLGIEAAARRVVAAMARKVVQKVTARKL